MTPRTDTPTLIAALRIIAADIQSGDGVANAAIAEAADRLEEMAEFARDVRDNYDCDSDAHKYGTPCRCCSAARVLSPDPSRCTCTNKEWSLICDHCYREDNPSSRRRERG